MCVTYDFISMLNRRETIDAHMSITGRVLEYLAKILSNYVISIRCMSKAMVSVLLKHKYQNKSAEIMMHELI